jgi:hypothetical protein
MINPNLLGIVCNVAFAVTQLVIDSVDFNTHLLAVFMINLFVYSVFYVIMKMHKREWAFVTNRIYPFLFLLAALAFWLTGSYFFLKKAAKWEVRTTQHTRRDRPNRVRKRERERESS